MKKDQLPPVFIACMVEALVGFMASAVATGVGLVEAWWYGLRVWVNSAVHHARRSGTWPPNAALCGRQNQIGRLILTCLIFFFMLASLLLWLACSVAINLNAQAFAAIVIGSMLGAAVLILLIKETLEQRLAAFDPMECWWEDPDS
jgi:hypothetical protein